jgi:hypothetical protein
MHAPGKTGGITMGTLIASAAVAVAVVGISTTPAASQSASELEGVWKVSRVVVTGANPRSWEHPQATIWIFSRGYYSAVEDTSQAGRTAPPPPKEPGKPTDAEKLAKYAEWSQFAAGAGTYELKGSTLIQHPLVAKSLSSLSTDQSSQLKLSGDTAVLVMKLPGDREETVTLTRLR